MFLDKKCKHLSAMMKNCKFCPDCGKKIMHKWTIIKCRFCGHYRKPEVALFGKIKPVKKYCFNCGSEKWGFQYYYEANMPDSLKLIAIKQIQTEEEYKMRFASQKNNGVKVWISKY